MGTNPMSSHLEQYPQNIVVITRSPSTISPPIIMAGDIISKVDRTYVNHIIHVTHARLSVSVFLRPCLHMLGSPKQP
jgi:hypothetical protein